MNIDDHKLDNPVWHSLNESHKEYAINYKFFVVGNKPLFSKPLTLYNDLVCNQMVLRQVIKTELPSPIVQLVSKQQKIDLSVLINLVQPGYFKDKTTQLGNYFGIYKDGQLIAVTGQRMRMNKFIEVSAVVTHPAHIRKGYAKQLVIHTTNQIFQKVSKEHKSKAQKINFHKPFVPYFCELCVFVFQKSFIRKTFLRLVIGCFLEKAFYFLTNKILLLYGKK